MPFEILTEISHIQTIATGRGIRTGGGSALGECTFRQQQGELAKSFVLLLDLC